MSDVYTGIIGQVYEDRRNGKSGTLVSRDDKCKTLMFRAADGSHFTASFSMFKTNMRKVYDENTISSVVVKPVSEQKPRVKKSKPKRKADDECANDAFVEFSQKFLKYTESFGNPGIGADFVVKKRKCTFVANEYAMFDCYYLVRTGGVKIFITPQMYNDTKWKAKITAVFEHPGYSRPICVYTNEPWKAFDDLRKPIIDRLEPKKVKEEK